MPLGTLDRTAPPLFNQGPSALSKLIFFSALSLFLMVADARFHIVQPVRAAIGAVLYPVQISSFNILIEICLVRRSHPRNMPSRTPRSSPLARPQ